MVYSPVKKEKRTAPIVKITVYGPEEIRNAVYESLLKTLRISRAKYNRAGVGMTWKMKRIGGEQNARREEADDEG